jgi:hypothetical protein
LNERRVRGTCDRVGAVDVELEERPQREVELEVRHDQASRVVAARYAELQLRRERAGIFDLDVGRLEQRAHASRMRDARSGRAQREAEPEPQG